MWGAPKPELPPTPRAGFDPFTGDRVHPIHDPYLSGPKPGGPGPYPVIGVDRNGPMGPPIRSTATEASSSKSGGGGWVWVIVAIIGAAAILHDVTRTTWVGTVNEPDQRAYSVEMTLKNNLEVGKTAGEIEYPALHCSGWLILKAIEGETYVFEERIGPAQENCVRDGIIRATKDQTGDKMTWQWFFPDGRERANAILTKKN